MHFAGLIPAGPGKSHQSLRDASLMAAIPGVAVVHPCNAAETRALVEWAVLEATESVAIRLAIGPSPRRIELPDGYRRRAGNRRRRARRVGRADRLVRARDAARGTRPRRSCSPSAGLEVGVVDLPWLDRVDAEWLAETVAGVRDLLVVEDHAPVGALGDTLRRALATLPDAPALDVVGVEGWPACGTPAEALRHHSAGRRVARRAGRAHAREPFARVSGGPVWVVVADPLTARTFFDCGIVDGLAARLGGRLRARVLLSARGRRRLGRPRPGRRGRDPPREELQPASVRTRRAARRGAPTGWLDARVGYYPLAIRLNLRHGFHRERMLPGHREPAPGLGPRRPAARAARPSSARCAAGTSARGATSRARFGPGSGRSDPPSSSRTCRCSRRPPSSSRPAGSASRRSATSRAGTTPSARG